MSNSTFHFFSRFVLNSETAPFKNLVKTLIEKWSLFVGNIPLWANKGWLGTFTPGRVEVSLNIFQSCKESAQQFSDVRADTHLKYLIKVSSCAVGRCLVSLLNSLTVASWSGNGILGIILCTWSSNLNKIQVIDTQEHQITERKTKRCRKNLRPRWVIFRGLILAPRSLVLHNFYTLEKNNLMIGQT